MKITKIMIPVLASAMLLTGCDDQIMKWGDDRAGVTSSDLPLAVKEVIANYDNIKDYAAQHTPNMLIGIGMGADLYCANENGEGDLANANYQLFTPGNAMKGDAIMSNSGALNFATVDKLIAALDGNMKLYGHNFFWHTQQNQTYLKSVIAPTLVVESSSDIQTILANGDFESGKMGAWQSWGNDSQAEVCAEAAKEGGYGIKLTNPKDGSDYYVAQLVQDLSKALEVGKTYTLRFNAKSSTPSGSVQFAVQKPSGSYPGEGYKQINIGTDWTTCEIDFTVTKEEMTRFLINFGKVAGTYYLDNIEFGVKEVDPMDNVLGGDDSDFEGGTVGSWMSWGGNKESVEVKEGVGYKDSYGVILKTKEDGGTGNSWKAQFVKEFDAPLATDKKYILQFYAKSNIEGGKLQIIYQNKESGNQGLYKDLEIGKEWAKYEVEFSTPHDDSYRVVINFGEKDATYYLDNIKFGLAKDQGSEAGAKKTIFRTNSRKHTRAASKMYYVLKTPAEKQAALENVMDAWVKGVAEHLAEKNVVPYGYDVINEPIADGSNGRRGLDEGIFGTDEDKAPEETVADGLNLNWGSNHWYWGYYVPDYHVKAFQLARRYLPTETKLFINDYNLETSPGKLAALIDFVKDIDQKNGSPIVDGIGTQMHITLSCSDDATKNAEAIAALKTQIDAMFQTMAATGKLVRVTELDLSLGTKTPSSNQYKAQSDAYRMIVESYKANVPEAQQSGITIWSLSDNPVEHEYWLKDQVPNLFDTDYKRKWAYKGFCDGIAGEDLGLKYGGTDYKAYYEKSNVSSSVDK